MAERFASCYLSELPQRLAHVRAVGETASAVARSLCPEDESVLACAGLLHDIGYSPTLASTSFHPLDGARWLRTLGEERLSRLVAHHTGARFEAAVRGLGLELNEFPRDESIAADVLAFSDLTTGPSGDLVGVNERIADVRDRYPANHPVLLALEQSEPYLRAVVTRVQGMLTATAVS